ncbi:hypothetical protein PO909_002394 [Leuciscus waleckii]
MATKENITTKFKEEDFTLRDSANYRYHLQAVCENPDNGYPTSEQYNKVCSALVTKYQFLRDRTGRGYESWHEILKNKFKKERSPLVDIEEINKVCSRFGKVKNQMISQSIQQTRVTNKTEDLSGIQDMHQKRQRSEEEPRTANPVLYIKGRALVEESLLEILMEGEKVCEVDDLTMALAVLMAIHFIFNIEYAAKTLKFVEKFLMCHIMQKPKYHPQ